MIYHFLALTIVLVSAIISYKKQQLTLGATIWGVIVSIVLYISGGWIFLFALGTFFISSSIVSNVGKKYKKKNLSNIHENLGKRNFVQAFANSGFAVFFAIVYSLTKNHVYEIAVLIAFACYNADTWASELGVMSKKKPIFILGFKKAEKGISGAVTLFGTVYSLLGSMLIALIYILFNIKESSSVFFIISFFGFLGSIIDSVLGQLFQVLYYDEYDKKYTEKRYSLKKANKKIKGHTIINNDMVNVISPLISLIIYIIFNL